MGILMFLPGVYLPKGYFESAIASYNAMVMGRADNTVRSLLLVFVLAVTMAVTIRGFVETTSN